MPVYIDPLHSLFEKEKAPVCFKDGACHLYADSVNELHEFAKRLGLRRNWFQDHKMLPHYDLIKGKRFQAIKLGAIQHTREEAVLFWKNLRKQTKMTHAQFIEKQKEFIDKIMKIGETKGKEYANSDVDRFANFKEVAKDMGVSPEVVLWVYVKKHLRAVDSFIRLGNVSSEESISGRLQDISFYCMLLDGMIAESKLPPIPKEAIQFGLSRATMERLNETDEMRQAVEFQEALSQGRE